MGAILSHGLLLTRSCYIANARNQRLDNTNHEGIMGRTAEWVLTDARTHGHVDGWSVSNSDLGLPVAHPWRVRQQTLRGGLSDGVDIIEVHNGELAFTILPTRGMGIWRGEYRGMYLGWKAPVIGPVHPQFVNHHDHGGIGWLAGFDEWIVRCGLSYNGAPGVDHPRDDQGNESTMALTLHGRIANLPAHRVVVAVELDPPYRITVTGEVDESMLFFPQLRLQTVISTIPGSNSFTIQDTIYNLRGQSAELELLYHCNFGPPLLEEGGSFVAPVRRLAPREPVHAKMPPDFAMYSGPIPGLPETVYFMQLMENPTTQKTLAYIQNAAGDKACALRFSPRQLPWFTLWKNPGALSDGYVTGLEPGTDLPNNRGFERSQGRVIIIPPGQHYQTELVVEVSDQRAQIQNWRREVEELQDQATVIVCAAPQPDLSRAGQNAK